MSEAYTPGDLAATIFHCLGISPDLEFHDSERRPFRLYQGAPIAAVEVRIDNGPWLPARLFGPVAHNGNKRGLAWRFWTFGWGMPAAGQHSVTSRAFDVDGNVQPAPDDPFLASKVTFWESNGHITRHVFIP